MVQWNRRDVLRSLANLPLAAGVAALAAACGGSGGSSYGGSSKSSGSSGSSSSGSTTLTCSTTPTQSYTISANHGHTACIGQTQLDGTDGSDPNTITLSNVGHTHTITLTDAEITQIKNHSATIAKTTNADSTGHSHVVTYM